jgi:hypothetical protein
MVTVEIMPHGGKELTGKWMYHFAENFHEDLGPYRFVPFARWYDRVAAIPYRSDDEIFPESPDEIIEVVARPGQLMNKGLWPRLDCKKKAILIGAWAAANGVPFAFVAVSERLDKEIEHVFPVVCFNGEWVTADATLPGYHIGQVFPITRVEELTR